MPLYKEQENNVTRVLSPASGNATTVDIVNDYAWTLSPKEARVDVPYARAIEYQQTTAQLLTTLYFWYKQGAATIMNAADQLQNAANNGSFNGLEKTSETIAKGAVDNNFLMSDSTQPYKHLYVANPTNFVYRFPYFDTKKHSRNTSFGESKSNDALEQIAGAITGSVTKGRSKGFFGGILNELVGKSGLVPGKIGLLTAQTWNSTTENDYTIAFDLLNTGSIDDITKNREFCYLITYQNSPSRRNFFITDPVVLYDLYIPDVVSLPVCHISGLTIDNIGNTQLINDKIIPEAYRVNITFRSLLDPSRNIFAGLDNQKNVVKAISTNAELMSELEKLGKGIQDMFSTNPKPVDSSNPIPGTFSV